MSKGILSALEYHGRLLGRDGKPLKSGRYSLRFSIHPDYRGERTNWAEVVDDVRVDEQGAFHVVLGRTEPVKPLIFKDRTRWMSVRVVDEGRVTEETTHRQEFLGVQLQLVKALGKTDGRLESVSEDVRTLKDAPNGVKLKQRLDELEARLDALQTVELAGVHGSLDQLMSRVGALDRDDGRVERIEDRLDDVDGPDGDIIDVNERMDGLERRALVLLGELEPTESPSVRRLKALSERLDRLEAAQGPSLLDSLPGPLTIEKVGLIVESGSVVASKAIVTTLEASRAVRTERLVATEIELRGDLTVDNTQRSLQIRRIEGRVASAKRDGPLHLNTRSGGEVVVGQKGGAGLKVNGPIDGDALAAMGADVAERFTASPGVCLEPGELTRMAGGRVVTRSDRSHDSCVVGVVSEQPGLTLGEHGEVVIALKGTVRCRVVGPIEVGQILTSSDTAGHACAVEDPLRAMGAVVGKAMEACGEGPGEILVLVG